MVSLLVALGCLCVALDAQMIIQSCVRDITVSQLSTSVSYPTGTDEFYITISVDSVAEAARFKNTTKATVSLRSAEMPQEICFDFDTSNPSTDISRTPFAGNHITFAILGDAQQFGGVQDSFPNPSNGSVKSSFISRSHTIPDIGGTISYNLYHQISTENVYLKIANRNFNVYRKCFELKKLCIYPGGIANPIYPNDCINNTILQSTHITLQPPGSGTPEDNILDDLDATTWAPPAGATMPVGGSFPNCWAPYSQYIMIRLADVGISAFSSISLGFTADPTQKDSGAIDASSNPPRWVTFAFDSNPNDLIATTSDILTDQFWAVDLRDGNFESNGDYVWTVNPLYFQLDTNPQFNSFRMTQITKGFGLQYLRDASLEYRSPLTASTGWYTYAAAYIDPNDVNHVDSPSTQVEQLAEVACRDIFPTASPSVALAYKSGQYNTCWDYASNQNTECYDDSSPPYELISTNELFYPPAAYIIDDVIRSVVGWTTQTMKYCVDAPSLPIATVDDWSGCNVTSDTTELRNCINDAYFCNRNNMAFVAMPMGWECQIPNTPEPTTGSPTTNNPTSHPTTTNPTSTPTKYPTSSPTKTPSLVPSSSPTKYPTVNPTKFPTTNPTQNPTSQPTTNPTFIPTVHPTMIPTHVPTKYPTIDPTNYSTIDPTNDPTVQPTVPTNVPSFSPSGVPSYNPTKQPSKMSTEQLTEGTVSRGGSQSDPNNTDSAYITIIVCLASIICIYLIYKGFKIIQRRNALVSEPGRMDAAHIEHNESVNDEGQNEGQLVGQTAGEVQLAQGEDEIDDLENDVDHKSGDNDIVKVVNQTADLINTNENEDEDIINAVNQTAGANDDDVINAINQTSFSAEDA